MIKRCLLLGFAILLIGCDARTQVLQEKITNRIDKLLGEFEVKKKQAEIATKKYQEEIDQLTKSKIETKVRLTQLQEKAQVAEAKQAEVDKTILRLRDYLAQGGEVEISGKKYSESQVKEMAEKLIAARKKLVSEIDVMKKSSAQIESIYTSLEAKESKAKGSLEGIKMTLDTIKIKTDALTAMQASSSNSNVGNDLDFESLEQQVAEISNKLDIELAFEQQKTDSNLSPATSIDVTRSRRSTV
jgi:chromosome segregation ATPase